MVRVLFGLGIMSVSGLCGALLDHMGMNSHPTYWLIGVATGLIAGMVLTLN